MYILISPAKKQFIGQDILKIKTTQHAFANKTKDLMDVLQNFSINNIAKLMNISEKLAILNYQRFQDFDFDYHHSFPAGFLFQGDVYQGLDIKSWTQADLLYAQNHLAILSGLYGKLRLLDKIQSYRLEMKTKISTSLGGNLYDFWGDDISLAIAKEMQNNNYNLLVNLASNEYSKAVKSNLLPGKWLNIAFKEPSPNGLRIVALRAKRARGLMAAYLIKNKINNRNDLRQFDLEGYEFAPKESTMDCDVFIQIEN